MGNLSRLFFNYAGLVSLPDRMRSPYLSWRLPIQEIRDKSSRVQVPGLCRPLPVCFANTGQLSHALSP